MLASLMIKLIMFAVYHFWYIKKEINIKKIIIKIYSNFLIFYVSEFWSGLIAVEKKGMGFIFICFAIFIIFVFLLPK